MASGTTPITRPVRLTPRDVDLLEDLAGLIFASADLLAERHYPALRRETAHRYLRRLRAGGYLVRSTRHLLDRRAPSLVYALTPLARQVLARRTPYLERTSDA